MARKLDLSKLTEDEAQHVLQVVQRDLDLRKQEEDRLGIVNTGSLDWFYNHVKSRFKNFGSAKVMRSLHKRLQLGEKHRILRHLDACYEQDGFDNVSDNYSHGEYNPQKITGVIEEDEPFLDHTEAHRFSELRRSKRLLSVHPIDFDMDSEYSAQSRRQSLQLSSPHYDGSGLQSFSEFSFAGNSIAEGKSRRESLIGDAELASVFRNILHEKGQNLLPESEFNTEVRLEMNKRRRSLDKPSKSDEVLHHEHRLPRTRSVPGIWTSPGESELHHSLPYPMHGVSYYADMESSDNDEAPEHPVYQRHFVRHRNKSFSQENSASGGSQSPANTGKLPVSPPVDSEASDLDLTDADIEEKKLKKKLGELASNISDKGASSDEEEIKRKTERTLELTSSSEDHSETVKAMMVHQYPRRKYLNSTGNKESKTAKNDTFHQNLQNRGSLTQRNPSNKRGRLDRVFGKPVMSMRP